MIPYLLILCSPIVFLGLLGLASIWGTPRPPNWRQRLAIAEAHHHLDRHGRDEFMNAVLGPSMWPSVYTIPGGMGEVKHNINSVAHRKHCKRCGAHLLVTANSCRWCGTFASDLEFVDFNLPRSLRDGITVDGRSYLSDPRF